MPIISGPHPAEVLVIGDFPEYQALANAEPFSDLKTSQTFTQCCRSFGMIRSSFTSTYLFNKTAPNKEGKAFEVKHMLAERKTSPGAGWLPVDGFWVDPVLQQAKASLLKLVEELNPKLIIAAGPLTLWALAGVKELSKWRGSRLQPQATPCPILPVLALDSAISQPENLAILKMDFARGKRIYEGTQLPRAYQFLIEPSYMDVMETLMWLMDKADAGPVTFSGDLETRLGHIACFGIAWSEVDAICIPFLQIGPDPFYWTDPDQEAIIVHLLQDLFKHKNITWVGQNYLYDCQYFYRHWGFLPIKVWDTMIGHHAIYTNIRKGLDFLSSMYAHDHVYWKDEIKEWDPKIGEKQYWTYNCKDACITLEIAKEISNTQKEMADLAHCAFQQSQFFPVLRMMNRGVKIDNILKKKLGEEVTMLALERQELLNFMVGHDLNVNSPKQLMQFFYDDLGIPGVRNFKTDNLTTNSPTMALIAERVPALKPICQAIVELRSLNIFKSTFIDAELDTDGRMRCSFGIAATETNRYNSRENAFGTGMNMMNIPSGGKEKIKSETYVTLPNIRKLFIPDTGYTYFDMDLDRADLQVVVWEADDAILKEALRKGIDIHCLNACDVYRIKGIPYDELTELHPNYKEHRAKIGEAKRNKTKAGVHATNYYVQDRTLAIALGITVKEAGEFRENWFAAHPGIRKWHERTAHLAKTKGYIENRFGARIYVQGRINLPELLGWLPQSTVAGVIERALVKIDTHVQAGRSTIQMQIQVHDSLAGQYKTECEALELNALKELSQITIPYPDPLIIPTSIKTSRLSWGDCK